jgi:hypothetical protein
VIAINESFRLVPSADVLYACDFGWWEKRRGVPEFTGLKLSQDSKATKRGWGIERVHVIRGDDRLQLVRPGHVGWGGNGGFHALNLAVQFLPSKIVLVGYDMRVDRGLHWHGAHEGLNNPTAPNVERWRRCIDAAAEQIAAMGIRVFNASHVSALSAYPKTSLEEALEC